jgi:hypothetical protein
MLAANSIMNMFNSKGVRMEYLTSREAGNANSDSEAQRKNFFVCVAHSGKRDFLDLAG